MMPCHSADGFLVPLRADQALIEPADMTVGMAPAHPTADVSGFDKGPFQVAVHIGPQRPRARLAAAGMHTRRAPSMRGQMARAFKDARRRRPPHFRQGAGPLQPVYDIPYGCPTS